MKIHRFGKSDAMPVLWLHGWLGSGGEGLEVQALLGSEYRLICPDLPGHGSTPIAEWTLTDLLKRLAELARETRAVLGYSLGGRLIMMSAARHPLAFSRMVIESAHPGLVQEEERSTRKELDLQRAEELRRWGLKAFCEQWYTAPMWAGLEAPQRTGNPEELALALERFSLSLQPDLRPWLRATRSAMLWLAGMKDHAYGTHAEWVRTNTSHAVMELNGGHNLHAQCPAEWAEAVHTFLTPLREHEELV